MKKYCLIFLAVLSLLCSVGCVTTSADSEITPLSLYSKRLFSSENEVFFVGEGQADTERQAELLSFMDLNDKVYRYLGIEAEPESYRELTTEGTIAKYGLKIQEHSFYLNGGEYTYALIASADKKLLEKDRSLDMQKEEEVAQQVLDLVLEGDEYIKANMDIAGIKCYLQSMQLSYGLQYIDDELSFTAILEEVLDIIDAIEIKVGKVSSENATCQLKVTRHGTIIPSPVKNSDIKATFTSEDSRGLTFNDGFTYTTDSKGKIDFVSKAYNIAKSGTVYFNFDFDSEIEEIEKLSPSTADVIRESLIEKEVSFDYDYTFKFGKIAICVKSSDDKLATYLVDKYSESNIEAFVFETLDNETEEVAFQRFKNEYQNINSFIYIDVKVSNVIETRMEVSSVTVQGIVHAYDVANNSIVYDSNISYANGFGSTIEEAQSNAFTNFMLKMFTLLKGYYV